MPARNTPEKFWLKVDRSGGPEACWIWLGHYAANGYGSVGYQRRNMRTHRLAWELLVGPIPEGLVLDHKCRNRACCNPAHLRAVTLATNTTENSTSPTALNKIKTHCKRGHELTGSNVRKIKGGRECVPCALELSRQWRERRRAASEDPKQEASQP